MSLHEQPHHHILGRWRFVSLALVVVLSAGGYLLFSLWGGWDDVAGAAQKIGLAGIAVALLLSLCNYFLRFLRWQKYLHILGFDLPPWESFKIYLAGFALTTTPAKTGEMLRSLFLKDYGVSYHASFGAFLSERVSDLIAILLLAMIGLWEYPAARPACISTAIVIMAFILVIQKQSWLRLIQRWAVRKLPKSLGRATFFFIKILTAFRACFTLKTLATATLLGTIAWGAEGAAFHYILSLLNIHIDFHISLFIYSFSMLIGAITFLPGGLGGTEVTMLQLLLLYHAPAADAVTATIIIRLTTLWFSVILGLGALPLCRGGGLRPPAPPTKGACPF